MIESIQQEKAQLCKRIGDLTMRIPHSVCNGSVQLVRKWKEDRAKAEKMLRNTRASVNDLRSILSMMEKYL